MMPATLPDPSAADLSAQAPQVVQLFDALFEPDDLVEIRCLRKAGDKTESGYRKWIRARDIADIVGRLQDENDRGYDIYYGVNPRKRDGGGSAADVEFARCYFVDIDHATLGDAQLRLGDSTLPAPTVIIESGHGVHAYWKLDDEIEDFQGWAGVQRGIAVELRGDEAVHDAPRIMRVPGYLNVKGDPVPCVIHHIDARVSYNNNGEFPTPVERTRPTTTADQLDKIAEGHRHAALLSRAGVYKRNGIEDRGRLAVLLHYDNRQMSPPKPDDEIEDIARYVAAKPSSNKTAGSIEFPPIVLGRDLAGSFPDIDFLVDGYIARGCSTLLTGIWKGGKTTFLLELLRGFTGQYVPAFKIEPCNVLMITEEPGGIWPPRIKDHGLGAIHFQVRPFKGRPDMQTWRAWIDFVVEYVGEHDVDLLILDTWGGLAPMENENDAAQVLAALSLLTQARDSLATLLVHHPSKGDGTEGRMPRGSGALMGSVECLMEFRRADPTDVEDTRRVITAFSRFPETPDKIIVNWLGTGDGYVLDGDYTVAKKRRACREPIIDGILAAGPMSKADILELMPETVGEKTMQRDLVAGVDAGRWIRDGKGRGITYRLASAESGHLENVQCP